MKRIALIGAAAAAFALVQPALAQPVTLDFAPEVGDGWKVTQTRTQIKSRDGGKPTTGTTVSILRVVGDTDEGYVMEWTTESVSVGSVVIRDQPQLMIGVPIRFDADASGLPVRVHDVEKIVDTSLAIVSLKNNDKDTAAKTRALMLGMEPSSLAGVLLKDAGVIAQCHDFRLEVGVGMSQEVEMPNALGGPPIKANYTVTIENAGSSSELARIRIEQGYDPQSAAASMYETIKKLSGQAKADEGLRDGKLPALKMNARTACQIDRATGVALNIVDEREAATGDESSSDVRRIVLAPL